MAVRQNLFSILNNDDESVFLHQAVVGYHELSITNDGEFVRLSHVSLCYPKLKTRKPHFL